MKGEVGLGWVTGGHEILRAPQLDFTWVMLKKKGIRCPYGEGGGGLTDRGLKVFCASRSAE